MAADAQGGVAEHLAVGGEVDLRLPGGVEELGARGAIGLGPQREGKVQGGEDARAEGGALRGLAEAVHAAPPQARAVAGPAAGAAAGEAARPRRIPRRLPLERPVPVVHHLHVDRTRVADRGHTVDVILRLGAGVDVAGPVQVDDPDDAPADLGVAADAHRLDDHPRDEGLDLGGQVGVRGVDDGPGRQGDERQRQRHPPQPAGKTSTQGGKAAGASGTHHRRQTGPTGLSIPENT